MLEDEFLVALGTKHGYLYLYDIQKLLKKNEQITVVNDRRLSDGANAFRNDDFDGRKYFSSSLSSVLDSELFRDIDPQLECEMIPKKFNYC